MRLVSATKRYPPPKAPPKWPGPPRLTRPPVPGPGERRVAFHPEPLHPRQYRRSVLATALVAMLTWSVVGLPYSLFSWSLAPVQLGWVLFCYAWEDPIAGALGPVLLPLLWFRGIAPRWDRAFGPPDGAAPGQAAVVARP